MREILAELLKDQHASIDLFFQQLDLDQFDRFFQTCLDCRGLIVITGVGKSGIIAEKIATTLISTGTKALFLSPTNFLHGDLGVLGEKDLLIMISKSGESEELLNLVPFAKLKKTRLLA